MPWGDVPCSPLWHSHGQWLDSKILVPEALACSASAARCLSALCLICFTEATACGQRSALPEAHPCKQLYNHVAWDGYLKCISLRLCCYFPTRWCLLALFCSLSLGLMLRNAPAGNHINMMPL